MSLIFKYQEGGKLYKYKGRPNVLYKKDENSKWNISKDNGKTFIPIEDPNGTRTEILNKQAEPLHLDQWQKDKKKYGKDKISWYEDLNYKNWGLNDYSKYSSYNSAFRNAREAKEKEFVYKGERYSTKLIPKKESDLYWESKEFVKNYYENEPYRKMDIGDEIDAMNKYMKNKYNTDWSTVYHKMLQLEAKLGYDKARSNKEYINLSNLQDKIWGEEQKIRKKTNLEFNNFLNKTLNLESKNRINTLNKPSYFSITSQKPEDMAEDGYWDPKKNKTFMVTNSEPGKLNTTYVHELSHKADDIMDVFNSVPPINLERLNSNDNVWKSDLNQETVNYVSNPSEIEARKLSLLFYLKKNNKPWKAGTITEDHLYDLYNDYADDKLPYDIKQLLALYGNQREDLLNYLNGKYIYKNK